MGYKYRISRHSVYNINYHIVFCPKRRSPILVDRIVDDLTEIFHIEIDKLGGKIESLSVQPDHVHLFVSVPPSVAPHIIVKNLKGSTSGYLRKLYPHLMKLPTLWSRSYYVGTVGFVSESVVKNYIANQKKT